ncbi:hypothetical protein KIN20_007402 [Parelaphostrongylus tenuis]|uniref:Uncharacterized protein n=1 Tax=Parelaphostrongylus tenuis TaxID=148309 RepID=A0AAD5MP41_PARTN|nr:hypothetical protein KIN20_007402 [Parelaphostrongylus tenuis]
MKDWVIARIEMSLRIHPFEKAKEKAFRIDRDKMATLEHQALPQARSAVLPDAVISVILVQADVKVTYTSMLRQKLNLPSVCINPREMQKHDWIPVQICLSDND